MHATMQNIRYSARTALPVSWELYARSRTVMGIAVSYIAVHGISLPGYVIGLAVSSGFLIPIISRCTLYFRAVQATQANLYFPNRSTLMSNCKL